MALVGLVRGNLGGILDGCGVVGGFGMGSILRLCRVVVMMGMRFVGMGGFMVTVVQVDSRLGSMAFVI